MNRKRTVTPKVIRYRTRTTFQVKDNKAKALAFCILHGRRPRKDVTEPEERRLGQLMSAYACPTHPMFDPRFLAAVRKLKLAGQPELVRGWNARRERDIRLGAGRHASDAGSRLSSLCVSAVAAAQAALTRRPIK